MTTEKFTADEFLAALPPGSINRGYISGELVFHVPLDKKTCIVIRSTIRNDGQAADTGKDSIRLFLADAFDYSPIAPKIDAWTQRTPGWAERINAKIDMLRYYREQAGDCPYCGQAKRIGRTENRSSKYYGKLFAVCNNKAHNTWKLIRDYDDKPAVNPSSKIQIPVHPLVKTLDISRANPYQRSVIEAKGDGVLVISAGAGSGKTYVLENTIVNMILSGIPCNRIVAVTFNAKAAGEARVRIAKAIWGKELTDPEIQFFSKGVADESLSAYDFSRDWLEKDPIRLFLIDWVCTIHALCYRLLRAYGENVHYPEKHQEYLIADLIKDSLAELKWDESPENVKTAIGWATINLIDPHPSYSKRFFMQVFAKQNLPLEIIDKLCEIYIRYMTFMRKNKLVDFNMMQADVRKKLKENPDFLTRVQGMFDYVLVDEAQDTGEEQSEIVWTIARGKGNLFFVGDTRQSLYKWRGAVPAVMEELMDKAWGNVKRMSLPINYRSTKTIVDQSNKMIALNYKGKEQYLFPAMAREEAEVGDPLQYYEYERINDLGDDIARIVLETGEPGKWFVLSRTRAECAALHLQLIRNKIPAQNLNGGIIFGAAHIRKVLAYAQLAVNWNNCRDNTEILNEVANVASDKFLSPINKRRHLDTCHLEKPWSKCNCPVIMEEGVDRCYVRYYGKESIDRARNWDGILNQRFEVNKGGFPTTASYGAADLVDFVERIEDYVDDAKECIDFIIDKAVMPWLAHDKGISQDDLGENGEFEDFDVLKSLIEPGISVAQFLKIVDDLSKGGERGDADSVKLMTVHKSKGAENDYVILNTTRLPIVPPKPKKNALIVSEPPSIEDERNIMYVGVTRAKKRCILMGAMSWNEMPTQRCPFIYEMDVIMPEDIEAQNDDISEGESGESND